MTYLSHGKEDLRCEENISLSFFMIKLFVTKSISGFYCILLACTLLLPPTPTLYDSSF